MSDDTKKPAEEIQDQDLDQAQGGVQIDHNHMTVGRISANESSQVIQEQVAIGGDNPFNTADGLVTQDSIAVNINNDY